MKLAEITAALVETAKTIEDYIERIRRDGQAKDIMVTYFHLYEDYKALDEAAKAIYHLKDKMDKFLVPEALENLGTDKMQIPDVARSFYINTKWSASIIDKERGFEYLRANGAGSLISETVNAGTLASYAKDLMVNEGRDLPEDIFKVTTYRTTGMSRYTPKAK